MTPPDRHRRLWPRMLSAAAVLIAGAVVLRFTACRPAAVPVTVYTVKSGRVEDTVVNSRAGTVQSRHRAGMSPGIPGLVTAIPARKGQQVREGDILLRLDDSEHRAAVELASRALEAARAAVEQARLEADLAQRHWERTRRLASNQVVSATVVEQDQTRAMTTQTAALAAQAQSREGEARLDAARATLAKTILKAPFDGIVLDITTEVGEWISPAPPGVFIPPVVDLIDPESLYVSAPIDEADIARIRVGLPVRITLDAFHGREFPGRLTYISSFVETRQDQNRTLRVEADFVRRGQGDGLEAPPDSGGTMRADPTPSPSGPRPELPVATSRTEVSAEPGEGALLNNLVAGLSADVEIILESHEDVVRIPTYGLLQGDRVLVVVKDHLVEKKVIPGLHNWSFTEITSGLVAGERVVVSLDRQEVVAGARVIVTGQVDP